MKRKSCARKAERACCSVVTYLPLAFVYGLTTWAVWVIGGMGLRAETQSVASEVPGPKLMLIILSNLVLDTFASALGIILYILLNWSYTTAVFTPPGSPLSSSSATYSSLPTHEHSATSFTVKSTGEIRYCKKCSARKPDRAHHCSSCGCCVLKMDHHCPWLATCVGLRNYKAFLLFLIYTSVFCWVCLITTSRWLWSEMFKEAQYNESLMPINYVLLCVISGIIGLVLTGFTAWHCSLAWRGQTTIECLEKTRYLSPLRKTMRKQPYRDADGGTAGQGYGQQLAEIHANALPGITRPEEGVSMLEDDDLEHGRRKHQTYEERERSRERDRYEDYLDEQDSEKLPNAFDLGWKRNLRHLLGEKPLSRCLPICNTTGDGWRWEANPKWIASRDVIRRERERKWREEEASHDAGSRYQRGRMPGDDEDRHYLSTSNGVVDVPAYGVRSPGKADTILGRSADGYFDHDMDDQRPSSRMSMKTLRRRDSFSGSELDDFQEVVDSDDDTHLAHGSRSGKQD